MEQLILPSRDLYSLDLHIYEANNPKAVIQVIHGMEEHQGRYEAFANYLVEGGYSVVTYDLRGHGKSAPKLSHIADKKAAKLMIDDAEVVLEYIKNRFEGLPVYLFAHSMGTIISRVLLQTKSKEYSKVVLSGYPNPQSVSLVASALSRVIGLFKGNTGYSKLLTNASVGAFNKKIENPKTPLDWLSFNEDNIDHYIKDPLCGEEFTIGSYKALFDLSFSMCMPSKYVDVNASLPILLIAGDSDPCTGYEKGRKDSLELLQKAGFEKIEVITLPHMRHEILNEKDNEKVYSDILSFINKK